MKVFPVISIVKFLALLIRITPEWHIARSMLLKCNPCRQETFGCLTINDDAITGFQVLQAAQCTLVQNIYF